MKVISIRIVLVVTVLLTSCTQATPIVPIETATPLSTATPIPSTNTPLPTPVQLNVEPDVLQLLKDQDALNPDGSVRTANKYFENAVGFAVVPESIQHIQTTDATLKDVLSGTDNQGIRVFWNKEKLYWIPEFSMSQDYLLSENVPYVPLDAYFDGSTHYSAAVYIAEHPGLIANDASYPYYKINVAANRTGVIGFEISIIGMAEASVPGEPSTKISYKTPKPFYYLGLQQTKDNLGAVIYVVVKGNWNPTTENPDRTTPTFQAFDEAVYRKSIEGVFFKMLLSNKFDMPGELVPVFPAPSGRYVAPANEFSYNIDLNNPHVAALMNQDLFSLLPSEIQAKINHMLDQAGAPFDAVTNPRHVVLKELPPELSNMLLYTGLRAWY